MKLINLGGATGILEHKGKRFLFDPWLDEGIFHGAWHHYPPVNLPGGIESLGRFDYIYISHIHEDHCSLGTLQKLNTDAEIIIADRTPNFVLQFLNKNNLKFKKIHLISPYKKTQINSDFEVAMVTADPQHELNYLVDSGLVLQWDGFVLYNSNDCPPYSEAVDFIHKEFPKVDLALLPYSAGSSYPSCFSNLSHEQKLNEKERLFKMGMDMFVSAAKKIKSRWVMPFADQYVIVGHKCELNQYMPNPPGAGVVRDYFADSKETSLLLLNSGQSFDFDNNQKVPNENYRFYSREQRLEYAQSHRNSPYDHERFLLSKNVNLKTLVHHAGENLFQRLRKMSYKSETKLIIEVTDWRQKFIIDINKYVVEEVSYEQENPLPFLQVGVSANLLMLLLVGHISWNIADAALFIDYTRVPNNYDPKVHSLWNYLKI